MPFYVVTLQLPKKNKTQMVSARNEYEAMYRAEEIGKNRLYQAVKAELSSSPSKTKP
jgi:hypothetical protein